MEIRTLERFRHDYKLSSISKFLLIFVAIKRCAADLDNVVTPGCTSTADVCEFTWALTKQETMVWYDRATNKGYPVVNIDGSFYRRLSNCSDAQKLTEQELQDVVTADGRHRPAFFINDQMPGPTLVVYEKQEVVVRIHNQLINDAITIHWHGVTQKTTNWMDGVGSITQCNINPDERFTYRFKAFPAGTHWYHSHTGTQRTDGMFGALIVLPKSLREQTANNKPKVSPGELFQMHEDGDPAVERVFERDYLLMVGDWYGEESSVTVRRALTGLAGYAESYTDLQPCYSDTEQSDGSEVGPVPFESALINGKGRMYLNSSDDSASSPVLVNSPLEVFTVKPDEFYRFRVINPSLNFAFKVSIDNHPLVVTASDGDPLRPVLADGVILHTGERYDFYIYTNQSVATSFWLRAFTTERYDGAGHKFANPLSPGFGRAILRYAGAPDEDPSSRVTTCTPDSRCTVVNCPFREYPEREYSDCINFDQLRAVNPNSLPEIDPDCFEEFFINFHFAENNLDGLSSVINGRQFVLPSTPPAVHGSENYEDECMEDCGMAHCLCTYQVTITHGYVIQFVLVNHVFFRNGSIVAAAHPVHLHGHNFHVVKVGYPDTDDVTKWVTGNSPDIHCPTPRCHNPSWSNSGWSGGNLPGVNDADPPSKDTVIVPSGGYVVIRFKADNPGFWLMHCHIEIHQVDGMVLIIKEGTSDQIIKPPAGFPTCGSFDWDGPISKSAPNAIFRPELLFTVFCTVLYTGITSRL